jgi:opacity protein-like surface antigen
MMNLLHKSALTALALALGATSQAASAQIFRAEVDGGYSQFSADGDHDSHFGWGGAAGVDFDAGGFIIGGEGTFWWAPSEVHTIDGAGFVNHKTFEEWGLAARAGVMLTPDTLVYVKAGYVRNEQRKEFLPLLADGSFGGAGAPGYYYDHYKRGGWTAGAGVEQMISGPIYAKAEARWSDYQSGQVSGGTHTITGLLGIGVKFGGPRVAEVVAPPPPPPPPPPPATQTCPDGSVILATSTCPVPPPPPPPPPVERGERG